MGAQVKCIFVPGQFLAACYQNKSVPCRMSSARSVVAKNNARFPLFLASFGAVGASFFGLNGNKELSV